MLELSIVMSIRFSAAVMKKEVKIWVRGAELFRHGFDDLSVIHCFQ
jgi:hypothetical protein